MAVHDPLRETQQFDAMREALRRAVACPTADEQTRRDRRQERRRGPFRKRTQQ